MPRVKKEKAGAGEFPAKFAKVLGEEWMSATDSLDTEELKKIVVDAANMIEEQEKQRDADMELKQQKEKLKEMSGLYKEDLFYQKARIKYSLKVLESRGIKVAPAKEAAIKTGG